MSETNQPKRGIVLAGGASHGAYHVGVLQALLGGKSPATGYQPIDPDVISGISAGGFNAAVLLSQIERGNRQPAAYLEKVWLDRLAESKKRQGNGVFRFRGDPSEFLNPVGLAQSGPWNPLRWALEDAANLTGEAFRRTRGFLSSDESMQRRLVEQVNISSFVSMKPFKKSIKKSIDCDAIRNSRRALRIGAVRWKSGTMRHFKEHEMTDDRGPKIVRASAAVPGIFPHVKLDNERFCDGAAVENTPLSGAIGAGAEELHVITSVPPVQGVPTHKLPNTFDTLYRFIIIREASTLARDVENAKSINASLRQMELIDEPTATSNDAPELRQVMRTIGSVAKRVTEEKSPYKKIAVHVYHPPSSLGGILGLLDFDRKFLREMIRKGYDDTIAHDCKQNGCDT